LLSLALYLARTPAIRLVIYCVHRPALLPCLIHSFFFWLGSLGLIEGSGWADARLCVACDLSRASASLRHRFIGSTIDLQPPTASRKQCIIKRCTTTTFYFGCGECADARRTERCAKCGGAASGANGRWHVLDGL
jgi:hypothetical protein